LIDQIARDKALIEDSEKRSHFWESSWRPVLECMAEASSISKTPGVRQHSLSMLTDSFLDKRVGLIPINYLFDSLSDLCIPLAGRRILELRESEDEFENRDEIMIELELCIGLIFKPLRHHLKRVLTENSLILLPTWKCILGVLEEILKDPTQGENAEMEISDLRNVTNELTTEHLRNVIMVLIDLDILKAEPQAPDDITAQTWDAVAKMDFCKVYLNEWKEAAVQAVAQSQSQPLS